MDTIHLVSHTHWDREWYLTFQQFRLKLIHLIDRLLEILESDASYNYFLLDGQAIILEDYLQIRPDREQELSKFIKNGRLLIGPWYISPDEFLVSPESHIRNLLEGDRLCQKYGGKMLVGYLPDTFGHIGQMPQILQGFGIETACAWRGLDEQPCELSWQAPDGSEVLLSYLRDSYSNAASLTPSNPEKFIHEVDERSASLSSHSQTGQLLLMHGTDHMEPSAELTQAINHYQLEARQNKLVHSSLPNYFDALRSGVTSAGIQFPIITGELRSSRHAALLQNALSTRIWLKQRNQACETDLLNWVEPLSAFTSLLHTNVPPYAPTNPSPYPKYTSSWAAIIRSTWKLLIQCHPHDSICGTSIDQVAKEMGIRFDQVDQINHELINQCLQTISDHIDTYAGDNQRLLEDKQNLLSTIVVFNPNDGPQTGLVNLNLKFDDPVSSFDILDEKGNEYPYDQIGLGIRELISMSLDKKTLKQALGMINDGVAAGMVIRKVSIDQQGKNVEIRATLSDHGQTEVAEWKQSVDQIDRLLADPGVGEFYIHAYSDPEINLSLVAKEVPGHGYRSYWIRGNAETNLKISKPIKLSPITRFALPLFKLISRLPLSRLTLSRKRRTGKTRNSIENEFFIVDLKSGGDSISVFDKRSGRVFTDMHQLIDSADCGDLYNYCPLERDYEVRAKITKIEQDLQKTYQKLIIQYSLKLPVCITTDRKSRSRESVNNPITSTITLVPGVPRIDIHTEIANHARDHRLRVHFPAPFSSRHSLHDGHFEIVQRPIKLPDYDQSWEEPPRPEVPQRQFTSISNGQISLTIANRGLPEVEVLINQSGNSEIAITLLRCIGYLSRDDLTTRKGHAGPMGILTPDAQMIGTFGFNYSIIPGNNWYEGLHQAYAFNAPIRSVTTSVHPGDLPPVISFIDNQNADFLITAIKQADDNLGLLVRGFNCLPIPIEVSIKPWRSFDQAHLVTLDEKLSSPLPISPNGSITTLVEGNKIISIRFSD